MLFNFSNDFLAQVAGELKEEEQHYKEALKEDKPFEVLKTIQQNIKALRGYIQEFRRLQNVTETVS
jgi:hypothetical protein